MKAYIEYKRGSPVNSDIQKAQDGFENIVYDIVAFRLEDIILGKYDFAAKKNVFVGSIDTMSALFRLIGKYPTPIDYPDFLFENNLIKRNISKDILGNLFSMCVKKFVNHNEASYFVKPVQTKLFDACPITTVESLSYLKSFSVMTPVWISEKIDIISEYRCFVHKGELKYACNYSGAFLSVPDWTMVYKAIDLYKDAPVSYTIDVAILKDGSTEIVEFNDFWAIGSYGLSSDIYAQMLRDRYFEIVGGV